jgi:hypothetical protein
VCFSPSLLSLLLFSIVLIRFLLVFLLIYLTPFLLPFSSPLVGVQFSFGSIQACSPNTLLHKGFNRSFQLVESSGALDKRAAACGCLHRRSQLLPYCGVISAPFTSWSVFLHRRQLATFADRHRQRVHRSDANTSASSVFFGERTTMHKQNAPATQRTATGWRPAGETAARRSYSGTPPHWQLRAAHQQHSQARGHSSRVVWEGGPGRFVALSRLLRYSNRAKDFVENAQKTVVAT